MAIITISRQLGSLGNEIAHGLAEEISYNLLNKEMISQMLLESGFSEKRTENFSIEEEPSFLDSFILDRNRFLYYIKQVMYEFARQGNVIIIGMGGPVVFRDFPNALRVGIIVPMDVRIQRIKEKYSCNNQCALHLIHDSDHVRSGFNRYFFNVDWESIGLYDLMINTDTVTLEGAIELIKEEVREVEKKGVKEEIVRYLDDLILRQKAFICILYEEKIVLPYLSIDVQDGTITLHGISGSEEDRARCETAVRKVPEVKDVINEIKVDADVTQIPPMPFILWQ